MARTIKSGPVPRRNALRWLAVVPAAAAVAPAVLAQEGDTGFTDLDEPVKTVKAPRGAPNDVKCLVKGERELTRKERSKLLENAPSLEKALKELRDYELADDVEPAFVFRALRAPRGGRP